MTRKIFYLVIGLIFLSGISWAQVIPLPTAEKIISKIPIKIDSLRDSTSSKFRTYTVIIDTIQTSSLKSDTLKTHKILELKPSYIGYYPGFRRRGVFNPESHFRWHSYWRRQLEGTFTFSEASFSDNWKSGGINSLNLGVNFDARADYAKDNITFTNEYQTQFGGFTSKGEGVRKALDKLFIDSKFGYKIKKSLFAFASANIQSQYINGYSYFNTATQLNQKVKISGLLAPGYLTESLGLEYKPDIHFSNRIGLLSIRQVFVIDTGVYHGTPSNYGVPIGKRGLSFVGFTAISDFHKEVMKNLDLKTHMELFQSYKSPSNTNLRIDAIVVAKVNKLINVNLAATMLYDNNQDPKPQFNQFLSLGFTYKYSEFK